MSYAITSERFDQLADFLTLLTEATEVTGLHLAGHWTEGPKIVNDDGDDIGLNLYYDDDRYVAVLKKQEETA